MRICHFCQVQMLESGSTWGKHQDTYEGYRASEQEACVFCTKIVAVLHDTRWQSAICQKGLLLKPDRPVYRWTLRKAAKIREMPDSFIITFRQVPADVKGEAEGLGNLPDLTFHMLRERGLHNTTIPIICG